MKRSLALLLDPRGNSEFETVALAGGREGPHGVVVSRCCLQDLVEPSSRTAGQGRRGL